MGANNVRLQIDYRPRFQVKGNPRQPYLMPDGLNENGSDGNDLPISP